MSGPSTGAALDPHRVTGIADHRVSGGTSSITTVFAPTLAFAPHRHRPQQLGAGADRDVVLEGRVALAAGEAGAAEGHPLVERHPVADLGGLADHHARAVVDEEVRADPGGGMDLDPGHRAARVGDHPRGEAERSLSQSAWATRWASSACTPAQPERISSAPTSLRGGVAVAGGGDVRGHLPDHSPERSEAEHRRQPTPARRREATCSAHRCRGRPRPRAFPPSPPGRRPRAPRGSPHPRRSRPGAPRAGRPRGRCSRASSSSTPITSSITERSRISGTKPAPIPWILCGPGGAPGEHRRGARLDREHLDLGAPLLQHLADPGDRAPGADPGDEGVDLAVEVAPDLLRGRPPVDLGVRRVRELLRHEGVVLADQVLGQLDRLVHPAERGRLVDLGAVGAKQGGALAAHPLRQGEDQPVIARGADEGEGDPGVAAGRLDDHRAAALDQAVPLGARRSSPPRSGP